MSKKAIITQAIIVLSLLVMVVVSLTTAWFTSSTQNELEDTIIEVTSSNTFDMSLDGYNFGRSLKIKFYDEGQDKNYNTLLKDVCPVLNTDGTSQWITLYHPVKDDYTGEPNLNTEWTEAVKTELMYDNSTKCYYVVNDNDNPAEYIEFDIWIRSDSALDIYLGSESYIEPYNADKPMYSVTEEYEAITSTEYQYLDSSSNTVQFKTITLSDTNIIYVYTYDFVNSEYNLLGYRKYTVDTDNNPIYEYYSSSDVLQEVGTNDDLINSISGFITNAVDANKIITRTYEYTDIESNTHKIKTITKGNTVYLYEYLSDAYSLVGSRLYTGSTDGIPEYNYYSTTDTTATPLDATKETDNTLITKISSYLANAIDENKLSDTNINQIEKTVIHYYRNDGSLVGITEVIGSTIKNYDGITATDTLTEDDNYVNNYNSPTSTGSYAYSIEVESPYSSKSSEYEEGYLTKTIIYNFSKNLCSSAMRVAFSEVKMSETDGVYTDIKEEFKYIWNPMPEYKLSYTSSGAYISRITNSTELTYSYSKKSSGIGYEQKTTINTTQTLVGAVQSSNNNVQNNEIPLCSTESPADTSTFSVKKVRVRIYVDGTDNESQNPLFSSSDNGNGKIKMKLQLVSQYDNVIVTEVSDKVANKANDKRYFLATMTDGASHNFSYSINNAYVGALTTGLTSLDIDGDGINESVQEVTITSPGVLVIYGIDNVDTTSTGRVGAITISINDITCVMTVTDDANHIYDLKFYENGNDITDTVTLSKNTLSDSTIANDIVKTVDTENNNKVSYSIQFSMIGTYQFDCFSSTGCGNIKLSYLG